MARIDFSGDERATAKAGRGVLFAFGINGEDCPGFADKLVKHDGILPPDQAGDLIDAVRALLKKFKQTQPT
jgi:hypothetical protein